MGKSAKVINNQPHNSQKLLSKPAVALLSALVVFILTLLTFIFPPQTYAQPVSIDCTNGFSSIAAGIGYKEGSVIFPRFITYHIVKVDLTQNIDLAVTPECALGTTTSQYASTFGASVAINGDLHYKSPWDPLGRAAAEGIQYSDPSGEPSLFISEDNALRFFNRGGTELWDAISGSHSLVMGGNIDDTRLTDCERNPAFCTIRPRTTVGGNGNQLIIVTVDGDNAISAGATLQEMAYMQLQCGAEDAINLDGGSSTTLVGPSGVIMGSNTTVANHLGVCVGSCASANAYCGVTPTPALPSNDEARPRYTAAQPYPFPCEAVAPDNSEFNDLEFHSLRPYQASPCNPVAEDLALFCGNDLVLVDQVVINKTFIPPDYIGEYSFEGNPISPSTRENPYGNDPSCEACVDGQCVRIRTGSCVPGGACEIGLPCGAEACEYVGNGIELCPFNISRQRDIAVDLEDSELPIMGYTEPSVGNDTDDYQVINNYFQDETVDDPTKVNEYVSWYLNGVIGRPEYGPVDATTPEGRQKMVDFSGPLKKLLSFDSQLITRSDEARDGSLQDNIRHDQVIGCGQGSNYTDCPSTNSAHVWRLSYWISNLIDRLPPLLHEYSASYQYWTAYNAWQFFTSWHVFQNIPFSSTEDRLGEVEIQNHEVHPLTTGFRILSSAIINQEPAELFFPHMQENFELADLTQRIFANQEADLNASAENTVVPYQPYCDLTAVRSNPGDLLFPGELFATVEYTAQVDCNFLIPYTLDGPQDVPVGNLCTNLVGGTCQVVPDDYECDYFYDVIDCVPGLDQPNYCAVNCTQIPQKDECTSIGNRCVPEDWNCNSVQDTIFVCPDPDYCDEESGTHPGECPPWLNPNACTANTCSSGYKCGEECTRTIDEPNLVQACTNDVQIAFKTVTKTPLAKEVWEKLVAGPTSVFRRIFPQIADEVGRPIRRLWDLPTATDVTYQVLTPGVSVVAGNPGSGRGSNAELYFPHIGGIHEYFLNCLQKTLRPQGFGQGCATGPLPPQQGTGAGTPPTTGVCEYPVTPHEGPLPERGGKCQPANAGWCSIATLTNIINNQRGLGWSADQIRMAAIICNGESGGWTGVVNDGCICGKTCDFSIGLFQINALPGRCDGSIPDNGVLMSTPAPNAFEAFPVASCPEAGNWSCDRGDANGDGITYCCTPFSEEAAQQCIDYWVDPETNIDMMVWLSQNGTKWSDWAYYDLCN